MKLALGVPYKVWQNVHTEFTPMVVEARGGDGGGWVKPLCA